MADPTPTHNCNPCATSAAQSNANNSPPAHPSTTVDRQLLSHLLRRLAEELHPLAIPAEAALSISLSRSGLVSILVEHEVLLRLQEDGGPPAERHDRLVRGADEMPRFAHHYELQRYGLTFKSVTFTHLCGGGR